MKTYDYINRVVLTLSLSVYEGTWTHSPLSLLCITMILRMRRIFFGITAFPNSGIRARSMPRCYMNDVGVKTGGSWEGGPDLCVKADDNKK